MVNDVPGDALGVPALQKRSRIPPLNARTDDVRVRGLRGGDKTGGQYRRGRRSRAIKIVQANVVLALGERQLSRLARRSGGVRGVNE